MHGDYETEPDPVESFYWFHKLADAGDSEGMYNIGLFCAAGYGVQRDFNAAAAWMDKAAAAGDEDAPHPAETFHRLADTLSKAEAGDAQAQAETARTMLDLSSALEFLSEGDYYAEPLQWAQKSAAQSNGDGLWALANAYEHGYGVEEDMDMAAKYYRQGVRCRQRRLPT